MITKLIIQAVLLTYPRERLYACTTNEKKTVMGEDYDKRTKASKADDYHSSTPDDTQTSRVSDLNKDNAPRRKKGQKETGRVV